MNTNTFHRLPVNNDLSPVVGEQFQPTRRKIVNALRQHGGMTAAELADLLGITSMGVRRHLTTLERDRLVGFELVQRGKGRPSYVYHLTEKADELFVKNYATLANELLGYLAAHDGGQTVIELFDQRAQRRIRGALAAMDGHGLAERVVILAEILSKDGYFATVTTLDDGSWLVKEHNCAVHDVAAEYRAACTSELSFLQSVLPDAVVVREEHMLSGDPTCTYLIRRR